MTVENNSVYWICERCNEMNPNERKISCKSCSYQRPADAELMSYAQAEAKIHGDRTGSSQPGGDRTSQKTPKAGPKEPPGPQLNRSVRDPKDALFSLEVIAAPVNPGKIIPLKEGANVLGNNPEKRFENRIDLSTMDVQKRISGAHASISCDGEKIEIRDMHSRNGTVLNQARMEPDKAYSIHDGDKIRIGNLVLKIQKRG